MEFITGRIVIVGDNRIITKKDGSFSSVIFVIKKKMNKKLRNIAFKCYGKVADKILGFRINDKIEVEYLISSTQSTNPKYSGDWYTNLQAMSVERVVVEKTINESQIKIEHND
jgi:hypothetical protein